MSWKASAFAKSTRGHPTITSKAVLLVLADYYNEAQGYAWCSQATLADDCEISVRSVRTALGTLETLGFITQIQKGNQHQPSHYVFNFTVSAQASEEAISGAANIAGTTVNGQHSVSEPESPRHTNPQEPPMFSIMPEWYQTLSDDPRWQGNNPDQYVRLIEKEFPNINLDLEAHNAYEWLQTKEGQKKKVLRGFWKNWLKNTSRPSPYPGRSPQPTRPSAGHSADELKDSIRESRGG